MFRWSSKFFISSIFFSSLVFGESNRLFSSGTTIEASVASIDYTTGIFNNDGLGKFSLVGLDLTQTLSWKRWINLEFGLGGAISAAGTSMLSPDLMGVTLTDSYLDLIDADQIIPNGSPARMTTFELNMQLYPSLPFFKTARAFIEPTVGYFWLHTRATNIPTTTVSGLDPVNAMQSWFKGDFYGPSAGFFLRVNATESLSCRFGGLYLMPSLSERNYGLSYELGSQKHSYTARRGGLYGLFKIEWEVAKGVYISGSIDHTAMSASRNSGNDLIEIPDIRWVVFQQPMDAVVGGDPIEVVDVSYPAHIAPLMQRTRIRWGANFIY